MDIRIFIFISIIFVTCENASNQTNIKRKIFHRHYKTQNYHHNKNEDISLPQLSTLEQFQFYGRSYIIPEGEKLDKFYDNYKISTPTAKNITSKNYPLPYPSSEATEYFSIHVEESTGTEIIVHVLDIDPNIDYLKIETVSGILDYNPKQLVLSGNLKEPLLLRALGITELKLTFFTGNKDNSHTHKGFLISYKPFGEIPPPVTNPPDVTIPVDDLDTLSRLVVIEEINQNNVTWSEIKKVLCNATNSFLNTTKDIYLEPCYPDNVTLTKVFKCPNYWPNSLTCIDLNFAITLFKETSDITTLDPFLEDAMPKIPGGLFYNDLVNMWQEYGRLYMNEAGYMEYYMNNNKHDIWLWGGIGMGIILFCFLLLYIIFKIGSSKRNWSSLEEEDKDVTKENEFDMSMFPSPDQIVPSLFPGGMGNTNSYNNSGYSNENRNGLSAGAGIRVHTFSESSDTIEEEEVIYDGKVNAAFVMDEENIETNYRVQVNGVNKDEAHT